MLHVVHCFSQINWTCSFGNRTYYCLRFFGLHAIGICQIFCQLYNCVFRLHVFRYWTTIPLHIRRTRTGLAFLVHNCASFKVVYPFELLSYLFITSLVWRGTWLVIERGTFRTRRRHSTTRLSRRRWSHHSTTRLSRRRWSQHSTIRLSRRRWSHHSTTRLSRRRLTVCL